jgi:hypothetical protein
MPDPYDGRTRPHDSFDVDVTEPCRANQILAVVSFFPPRLRCRVAQPGDDGPLLIAKQSSPDARAIKAIEWTYLPVEGQKAGETQYLAADGGYTATKPKSKARVVGTSIEGAVRLSVKD